MVVDTVSPHMVQACLNTHGTRVIQRLIDLTSFYPSQITKITSILMEHVPALAADINGNHVLQRCLTSLQPSFN